MPFSKVNPEKEAVLEKGWVFTVVCLEPGRRSLSSEWLARSAPRRGLIPAVASGHVSLSVTSQDVLLPLLLGSVPTPFQICSVYGKLITWKTPP